MTPAPQADVVIIAGAAGGFGRAFAGLLEPTGARLVGVDLTDDHGAPGMEWLIDDATAPGPGLRAALAAATTLLLCLPEESLFAAVPPLLAALPAGALVVDVTSVKTRYAAVAQGVRDDLELCSLEPMFAPDVGFAGQQVLLARLRGGPRTEAFAAVLGASGARLIETTAEEIDRQAAATQVAAHAALLAYGEALGLLGFDPEGPATALQRALLTLLARVTSRDPRVYWHIQRDNPYAPGARRALRAVLDRLDGLVDADDADGFAASVRAAGAALGPRREALADASARVVAAASEPPAPAPPG